MLNVAMRMASPPSTRRPSYSLVPSGPPLSPRSAGPHLSSRKGPARRGAPSAPVAPSGSCAGFGGLSTPRPSPSGRRVRGTGVSPGLPGAVSMQVFAGFVNWLWPVVSEHFIVVNGHNSSGALLAAIWVKFLVRRLCRTRVQGESRQLTCPALGFGHVVLRGC